jgi:hypothetical protein
MGRIAGTSDIHKARKDKRSSRFNGVFFRKTIPTFYRKKWQTVIIYKGKRFSSSHLTEHDAAIAADKIYIQLGFLDCLNLLKPISKNQSLPIATGTIGISNPIISNENQSENEVPFYSLTA